MHCPLCENTSCPTFCEDTYRVYLQCTQCKLVFVPGQYYLNEALERAEYEKHENSPDDTRYRQFLSRIANPLCSMLPKASTGLDFGCGPGPTLSVMLEEQGHAVQLYDKFFFKNEDVWQYQFDFISATEVLEHLHHPAVELQRLWDCLKPGGILGVMTKLVLDPNAFEVWHYKNDLTHVCFFSMKTFGWLAQKWQAKFEVHANDAFTFQKSSA